MGLPKNILCETSTISDGNMSFEFGDEATVVGNRKRFLEKRSTDYKNCICMACDHGEIITAVNRGNLGFGAMTQEAMLQSEVLITQEKNLALMLLTADCIPAIFYDPVQKIIALAHLNRKTIAHDLAQKTVDFLRERFKTNPADLLVHFGPHIKKESYYFPIPLAEKPKTQMAPFIEERDSIAYIDLTSAFLHQLEVSGVTKDHVTISDIDTGKSDQHFSHVRTQRNLQYPLGRLATIAMLHS